VWTGGASATAPADGALHLDVLILSEDRTQEKMSEADALGEASSLTRRAYIHYSRVLAYATRTMSDSRCVLALVLAHEIGHMLLPEPSHTTSGLMRANWRGQIAVVPGFSPTQAATIRALLASATADSLDRS
jgi:hypothetical protein